MMKEFAMRRLDTWIAGIVAAVMAGSLVHAARAEVKVVVNHNANGETNADFRFKDVPLPPKPDAVAKAKFSVVDGEIDPKGGKIEKLNDGQVPTEEDQPAENFFFKAGTEGGRIGVDLGKAIDIKQVNTYSWHPNTRAPQLYKLYASDGSGVGFKASPKKGADPEKAGWKLIASVDTRPKDGKPGGQYGVSISDCQGSLGKYKYLLFDCSRTESDDEFGNTFYSEIDVIAAAGAGDVPGVAAPSLFKTPGGKYEFTIDSSQAPEMKEWADTRLALVMAVWYPKIVEMLPSEGFSAPARFMLTIQNPGQGISATDGTRITCNALWMCRNQEGEAIGAIVHEMVHVVQQYGRPNPNSGDNPSWLVEGVADYVRWFKYEPQSHGADITDASSAKYDDSYRVTANFLNWASEKYDKDLVRKLNAAMREGKYSKDLWTKYTGKTADELGKQWKQDIAKPHKPAAKADAGASTGLGTGAQQALSL